MYQCDKSVYYSSQSQHTHHYGNGFVLVAIMGFPVKVSVFHSFLFVLIGIVQK